MQPLISVIIPTHNEAELIGVAINSILQQTWKNLEIIVVDDHSTDNTKEVVETIAHSDPRVAYYKLPHQDPLRVNWRGYNVNAGYQARNFGFTKARGEWITFQDSDDASLLNRIEVQYQLATKYDAMYIATDWQQFKEELVGKKLDAERIQREEEDTIVYPEAISHLAKQNKGILMGPWFPHRYIPFWIKWFPYTRKLFFNRTDSYPCAGNTPLFKREVLEKVQFRKRDDRVWPATSGRGADRDFSFQVAETFGRSYAFKLPLYLWRVKNQNPPYAEYGKYIV